MQFNLRVAAIVAFVAVGALSSYFLGADNELEELSEKFIEHETGRDIDFTPNSGTEQRIFNER